MISANTEVSIHPDDVVAEACRYFDVKEEELKGSRRFTKFVLARTAVAAYLHLFLKMKYMRMACLMCRDHTSLIHNVESHTNWMKYNAEYRDSFNEFRMRLEGTEVSV